MPRSPVLLPPPTAASVQHHTHRRSQVQLLLLAGPRCILLPEPSNMMKLRCSKKLFRRSSCKSSTTSSSSSSSDAGDVGAGRGEIEWEVRPGGMLVQKRDGRGDAEVITVRVATGFSWHDVSIGATCTFGELKLVLSMVTGLEPREQRLLFRGKEREDTDHLHMIGVRDKDKVLLLEDPALKDMKLRATLAAQAVQSP